MIQKRWGFGFGTLFSLIVVYFIYLYSKEKGWALLTFVSRWYLAIVGGLIALSVGIVLLVILASLVAFLIAMIKLRSLKNNYKKQKHRGYVDVDYKIKE